MKGTDFISCETIRRGQYEHFAVLRIARLAQMAPVIGSWSSPRDAALTADVVEPIRR